MKMLTCIIPWLHVCNTIHWLQVQYHYTLTTGAISLYLDYGYDITIPWMQVRYHYTLTSGSISLYLDYRYDIIIYWLQVQYHYTLTTGTISLYLECRYDFTVPWLQVRYHYTLNHQGITKLRNGKRNGMKRKTKWNKIYEFRWYSCLQRKRFEIKQNSDF